MDSIIPDLYPLAYGALGLVLLVLAGLWWGGRAALEARRAHSAKWKAYAIALLAPATAAVTVLFEPHVLAAFANAVFWVSGSGAVWGALRRYHSEVW